MKLHPTCLGVFQTRGGRQVSIFEMNSNGTGTGMLLPVSLQGEPDCGHIWRASGEYSASHIGVPHMNDLIDKSTDVPKRPEDYTTAK